MGARAISNEKSSLTRRKPVIAMAFGPLRGCRFTCASGQVRRVLILSLGRTADLVLGESRCCGVAMKGG